MPHLSVKGRAGRKKHSLPVLSSLLHCTTRTGLARVGLLFSSTAVAIDAELQLQARCGERERERVRRLTRWLEERRLNLPAERQLQLQR